MTKEEYDSLTACPGWRPFQAFLRDRRLDIMEALAGDHLVEADIGKAIKECLIYNELANLTWLQVAKFYNLQEDKESA